MSHFTKISSRGVQAKGLLILFSLVTIISFSAVFMPTSVYANNPCQDIHDWSVVVDGPNVTYEENIDQATAVWNEASETLTLNNYNGGSICFDGGGEKTIMLEGDNKINPSTTFYKYGIENNDVYTNIIKGDGSLTIESSGQYTPISVETLKIESGNIKVLNNSPERACEQNINQISGGSYYSECIADSSSGGFPTFYQSGGIFEIKASSTTPCLTGTGIIINGGTTNIECDGAPAVAALYMTLLDDFIPQLTVKTEGNIIWIDTMEEESGIVPMPIHGAMLFDGGDIALKSDVAAAVVMAVGNIEISDDNSFDAAGYIAEKGKDYLININKDLTIDAPGTAVDAIAGSDYGGVVYSTFTDGTAGASISGGAEGDFVINSSNIAKTLHIYKATTPVPSTDGNEESAETEENPNTLDTKIIALAFGVLASIIAEGIIIADLYRRLFGYKKEIAEIEEVTKE